MHFHTFTTAALETKAGVLHNLRQNLVFETDHFRSRMIVKLGRGDLREKQWANFD
jgi:hypothetical protein